MKTYTLAQASAKTGISIAIWSQGVQYGKVKSELRMNEERRGSKRIPIHHVTEEEIKKFKEFIAGGGYTSTMDLKSNRRHPEVDIAKSTVRRNLEMRKEAKELGMTLEEYRRAV